MSQTTSRRALPSPAAAPDPQAQPQDEAGSTSLYGELLDAVQAHEPTFAAPHPREGEQGYFKRLTRAVSNLPEEAWNELSQEAQSWYDNAAQLFSDGADLEAPEGFYDAPDEGATNGSGAAPAPIVGSPGTAPQQARRSRGAAPQQQQAALAQQSNARRATAQQQQQERAPSAMAQLRAHIIENPDVSQDSLYQHSRSLGLNMQLSSIGGVLSSTKATIAQIKQAGHWR